MSIGWPLASFLTRRFLLQVGAQRTARLGGILLLVGSIPYLFLSIGTSPWLAAAASFVVGFGMGLLNMVSLVMIQAGVDWSRRGSATSSNVFARRWGPSVSDVIEW